MAKEIVVECSNCGRKLKTDERYIGRSATCPGCGAKVRITAEEGKGAADPAQTDVATRKGSLLKVGKQNDVGVVTFTTSRILDQSNVQQLGDELDELLDVHKFRKVVLNFQNVGYMSSAVMGKLVSLHKRFKKAKGDVRLCNIDPSIFEIFKIMKFDKLFKICDSEDQAVIELMK